MLRVSVIVPTRNRLPQLQRAIAGVERQTFGSYEVIVVDDGSTDSTPEWLSAHGGGVRLVTATVASGAGAARNRGVQHARGELVAFLDDDDVWQPNYLEQQVRHLDANPGASLSWAGHWEVDPNGRTALPDTTSLMSYNSVLVRMLAESFIHTMSVVVCRRSLFTEVGPFDERLSVVQDLDWYARLLGSGRSFVHLPQMLVARSVPGGLVTRYRQWAAEEGTVLDKALRAAGASRRDRRLVRAYRALFFANLGFARMDAPFAFARLIAALRATPTGTLRVAARRLTRRVTRRLEGTERPEPADTTAPATL